MEKYVRDVVHFPHVVHLPSLPTIIEEIYTDLGQQRQVKPGPVILLLSMIVAATHAWVPHDCEYGLFPTDVEANDQAPFWVKATQDVVDIAHRTTNISIEGVQGLIVVVFMLGNMEGFSRRARALFTLSLFLARELGLHRIDHPSNKEMANTAAAEIGRRVWWNLCGSDW